MWDLLRTLEHIYIISSGKVVLPREAADGVEMGKVIHFCGFKPSVMFSNPRSWRRMDFSQHE